MHAMVPQERDMSNHWPEAWNWIEHVSFYHLWRWWDAFCSPKMSQTLLDSTGDSQDLIIVISSCSSKDWTFRPSLMLQSEAAYSTALRPQLLGVLGYVRSTGWPAPEQCFKEKSRADAVTQRLNQSLDGILTIWQAVLTAPKRPETHISPSNVESKLTTDRRVKNSDMPKRLSFLGYLELKNTFPWSIF